MPAGPLHPESPLQAPAAEPGAASSTACDYCGEPVSEHRRVERSARAGSAALTGVYCCLGCAFIAEQLAELPETPADRAPRIAADASLPPRCTEFDVRGLTCTACAQLVEHRLRRTAGVASASVDFIAQRARVVHDPRRISATELARCIEDTGYRVVAPGDRAGARRLERIELLRVLLAWLGMMQVMMLAMPAYLARPGEIAPGIEQLLRIAQLVLAVPVAVFCAAPFWRAARSQLRVGRIAMDVPVALGLAAALGASCVATLGGRGAVYFDSVTMFVALLLAVRWWQLRALARSTAQVDAAMRHGRQAAFRLRHDMARGGHDEVAAEELVAGDRVLVPAGEAIPADGRIVEGATSVSQAWLTGESAALERTEGDMVLAGSLNLGRSIVVAVTRAGDATSLAALQRMVIESAGLRPAPNELAQRVAARFALAVCALALLTALAWLLVDPAGAARATIAVLVVTCPCALALAAPLAAAVAQARLAAQGVLLTRPAALEALARADAVAFDKTGTLTEARPVLLSLEPLGRHDRDLCLEIAAGLEAHSRHPYALALHETVRLQALEPVGAVRVAEVPGMGLEGIVAGQRYRLGRPEFALALTPDPAAGATALAQLRLRLGPGGRASSQALLCGEDGPTALLCFGETLRRDAAALLRALHADGRDLLIVSGDGEAAVARVARELAGGTALPLTCHAERSPAGKRELLAQCQRAGRRVAMVGDGINDAPVLAQADASIALASGSRLAQVRADAIVLGAQLGAVQALFAVARRATRIARQNLAWALGYNALMVPLAACGLLAPWVAAAGMAASSAFVLFNSLRLRSGRAAGAPLSKQAAPWTRSTC